MTIQHATQAATRAATAFPTFTRAQVRQALLAGTEIALIDVREEDPFAQAHPLWAANFPLSKLELEAWPRIPRRDTLIVVYGEHAGEDLAPRAASVLQALGYTNVHRLEGGLAAWIAEGGEVFRDVNVPSKSFGEVVEAKRHTPSLSAEQVQALIDSKADAVIVDARRFDEYQTMSIPTATSVPGAELVLRVRELAPDPRTQVIVNCAGRTRSIIGTQSLVNAGIPQPGGGAAQRHHRLDAGGPAARSRRQPPRACRGRRRQPRQRPPRRARDRRPRRRAAHRAGGVAIAAGAGAHRVPLRCAHARGIRRRPPAWLRQCAGRAAGAGNRPQRPGARRAHRAGR
jgi:rhodanese-related sulfurtransferase